MRILGKIRPSVESTTNCCFPSVLLFWECHCINSAMSRHLYIRSNRGISGKCRRTFLGDEFDFNPSLYLPSLHFGHPISLTIFFRNNTQPFTRVWMFQYPNPSLVICALHALHFFGNVELGGNNSYKNTNNSSMLSVVEPCIVCKLRSTRNVVK